MSETTNSGPSAPYGQFVNWDARLTREGPFFRDLFADVGARNVLDVGAGSARHAIMFATWGLDVVAVDPSESMLAEAADNLERFSADIAEGGGRVRIAEGGFGDLVALGLGPFDVVTCTGNALPHVDGVAGLRVALADFAEVTAPGKPLVLHLLNHARLINGQIRSIPPKVRETPDGTRVFLRVMDYPGDGTIAMSFITLTRPETGEWLMEARTSHHTALPYDLLVEELDAVGFGDVELFGDHARTPFDPDVHESLLLVARRR